MDCTAVGDTTHLAARLQQLARPGQILISETTYRLIDGYCRTRSAGSFSPKGITGSINVREVIAAWTDRTRFDVASDQGLTPFVGRGYELGISGGYYTAFHNNVPE
jgi:hypothetical protein